MSLLKKARGFTFLSAILLSFLVPAAYAGTPVIASYYKDGELLVDDHNAEFEVISNSSGNPNLGDTVRVIEWSNGTSTTISSVNGNLFMGGYPATSYGVGHVGGRIYEAYCTDNIVNERVCYRFLDN